MRFLRRPNLELYEGIKVDADTTLEYQTEDLTQKLENLKFCTESVVRGEKYESTCKTVITLEPGDIVLFESKERGYVVPVEPFVTISEAIEDYENIKDLG